MSLIYGLYDPRVERVRYVGKTTMLPTKRLGVHISQGKRVVNGTGVRIPVNLWIAKLLKEGVKPSMRFLEECDEDIEDCLEKEWIATLRVCLGSQLLNSTDGGDGGRQSAEVRAKMSESHKALWRDPEYRKRRAAGPADRSAWRTPEARKRQSEIGKGLWNRPGYRESVLSTRMAKPRKTHCKWGHEFTIDNIYWGSDGSRACKACTCRRSAERYQRLQDKKNHVASKNEED